MCHQTQPCRAHRLDAYTQPIPATSSVTCSGRMYCSLCHQHIADGDAYREGRAEGRTARSGRLEEELEERHRANARVDVHCGPGGPWLRLASSPHIASRLPVGHGRSRYTTWANHPRFLPVDPFACQPEHVTVYTMDSRMWLCRGWCVWFA